MSVEIFDYLKHMNETFALKLHMYMYNTQPKYSLQVYTRLKPKSYKILQCS